MMVNVVGTQFASLLLQATPANPDGLSSDQRTQIALEALRRHNTVPGVGLALFVPIALFAMIVVIVWLAMRQKQARMRARAELHKQLLDKFNSGPEFTEFLESTGGKRFLEELSSQSGGPLSAMRNGILLTALGLGMLGLSLTRANHGMLTPAVILLALGAGYLISAVISHRLSKQTDEDRKLDRQSAPGS